MRRKIELYIGGRRADLNDQALVLFNYSLTDIQKPTAVKNAYSKQITLPGTPANDAIFSGSYRVDRTVGLGQFNPLERTAFVIYDEKGTILEQGYAKLDKVTSKGESRTYAVTLYGGLGSFFYGLSYKSNGEKMTLADLKYLSPLIPFDDELDFTMTADEMKANWVRVADGTVEPITFVPAYEGIPDGDFDAQKAVVKCADVGLPASQTDGDTTYTAQQGGTVINLAEALDEWAAKDLRCYLQRPALKIYHFLGAISNTNYNGGYEVDWSDVASDVDELFLTLPLLSSLKGVSQETAEYALTAGTLTGTQVANLSVPSTAVVGAFSKCEIECALNLRATFTNANGFYLEGELDPEYDGNQYYYEHRAAFFLQFVAYSEGGTVVGSSPVYVQCPASNNPNYTEEPEDVAALCNYTPAGAAEYEFGTIFTRQDTNTLVSPELTASFEVKGATRVAALLSCYLLEDRYMSGQVDVTGRGTQSGGKLPILVKTSQTGPNTFFHTYTTASATQTTAVSGTMKVTTSSQVRSGSLLKKVDFLSTAYTPADLLVSLAKTFGWCFLTDTETKKVTILSRDSFFGLSSQLIDLTDRIDRSKGLDLSPAYAGSKWYDLAPQESGGAFWDNYKDRYGVTYGIQRVNTGYDFDSAPVDLLQGTVLRGAVSALAYGPYWNIITEAGKVVPSPFIVSGHTYTLWAPDGSTKDFSVSRPSASAELAYYNNAHPGYDIPGAAKLELRDAEGKGVTGDGVLVWYTGTKNYPRVKVSDDSPLMVLFNEGKPCWDLTPGTAAGEPIPCFSRFQITSGEIVRSLDFGDVRELAIPDVTLGEDSSLYDCKWAAYLRDLLSKDTKILKCRVNLEGLDVGVGLLRRFFWYEGSLWVLNKINNYSLTTWDPAECEFVQVQEMADYNAGQIW